MLMHLSHVYYYLMKNSKQKKKRLKCTSKLNNVQLIEREKEKDEMNMEKRKRENSLFAHLIETGFIVSLNSFAS